MNKKIRNQYFSKTIDTGLRILSLFSEGEPKLSRTEISRKNGINMTSNYRFIDTLISLGYLRKDPRTKLVELGPAAFVLGHSFVQNFNIRSIVKPLLDQFYEKYQITIDSAVFYENTLLILYRRMSEQTVKYNIPTMTKDLFHCTALGKAVLAFLPSPELELFLKTVKLNRQTQNAITSKKFLVEELEKTRIRGYAINNEELMPGVISIGAPLINRNTNRPTGAVSLDFSTIEHTVESIQGHYTGVLFQLAEQISNFIFD